MKSNTVLISVHFLAEVPVKILEELDFNDFDRLLNQLGEDRKDLDSPFEVDWESTHTLVLDPSRMNCGNCDSCGRWVSNREAPEVIGSLNIAGVHEGRLLCDECLPEDHRLAF